ncbi:helicase HerA domain-containing protein [Anthocerotibacter panamensis]|uniref:helicase HerA domain-containing protein n=1 Tax=Anthocerotibacter panamensis TaxID=2857077 RepID=UPI001FD97D54|nr:ATP-binding protein [Anthocerotibacter panamensis]
MTESTCLGLVVTGSLSAGLEVRLDPTISVEDIRVGKFVIIRGKSTQFFSMLTDVILGTASPKILMNPPNAEDDFLAEILMGTGIYGTVKVTPMLMLEGGNCAELRPVKTVPSHFSKVYESSSTDFAKVFGLESDPTRKNFYIGQPLDMDVPVCLDLERFVERSNGIFGKSGTGKSFLTRLILCGTIQKEAAVNLIFDMHSEYGWEAAKEGKEVSTVKGLQQLFPGQVKIFSLDPDSTKRRGVRGSQEMYISLDQIEIEDLALVRNELNVSETSLENAIILRNHFGPSWISRLGGMSNGEIQEFCQENMGNAPSIMALQRKLLKLEDLKYIKQVCPHDYIGELVQTLAAGRHVVIEFGSQGSLLGYMLATNIITRRLHAHYVKKAEKYLQSKSAADKPRQLMITIEEAHRFLDPRQSRSTIFGTIAREMRKYFVTLLVVDQRPSGIDNEVMSQMGTRITAALNDDKDIEAIFTGMSGGQALRTVLAQMDPKQQALILGYAVPMPVVVRTRAYDSQFYREIGAELWETRPTAEVLEQAELAKMDLGF